MGTRHRQIVINKEGITKLDQYGQWDGYPSGQGIEILEFLLNTNLKRYEEKVSKLKRLTKKEGERITKDVKPILDRKLDYEFENLKLNENEEYYALSRNCGSDIHNLVLYDKIKYVQYCGDDVFGIQGTYTIDFSKNTFKAEYDNTSKEYLLDALPTIKEFLKDFKE